MATGVCRYQDSSEHTYSPMILTNTRFRRRPSRLPCQPSSCPPKIRSHVPKTSASPRRELGRTLSEAVEPAVGRHDHRCASRPIPLQVRIGLVLAGAVVQPAQRPASSLMEMRGMIFTAFTTVSPLFVIYHTHAPAGRGPGGHRPRPEQPQLNPALRLRMNPAEALLADIVPATRAERKAQ
jgi:hypothetical protein